MANIKVAVRMRPISARELNLTGSEVVVCAESNEISLTNLKISSSKAGDSRERTRRYGFDYCFDSSDPKAKNYATQAMIYETLGQSILDALFDGYNSCLVAYGQSASGKTYTMMGTKEDPGLIPRLCEGIFSKVEQESGHERIYRVTVSYLEIYNEKVRDLLKPSTSTSGLRIREHPRLGPYVQGLTHHVVRTLGSLMSYVEEGTKARKTASTLQNPSSSRSHALLTVDFSQDTADAERLGSTSSSSRRQDITSRGGSRLHLVDLAGSESAATCGGVHRLKEGANINKSLVALGNVISALAERGSNRSGPGRRYIPYRDSSLTWLLKDALGGNATTIMLATISPASGSYNETAHTLRFAQRAQSVVNRPVVNEDPVERLIRELKAEVARLKSLLLAKDIDQQTKASCCCKVQSSKDWAKDPQYCGEPESLNTLQSDCKNKSVYSKNDKSLPIRRFNSSDSVTTYETGSSGSIRKFNSYEHLQFSGHFADNYNQAKIAELNEKEDEVVSEINEPVFVDIPTLVAVLIKPDNNLQESSTQIEEICSDEVQEDSIDADFIQTSNEEFDKPEKIDDIDPGERSNSTNSCNALDDSEIGEHHQIPSECPPSSPASVESSRSRGKFSKQNSIDLPSSNLNVSKKFGSIEGISKKKEPTFDLQRSHTNLEKRSALSDRGKKLNNIREIDDRKANIKSANIWKAIGNVDSKDRLQRKSSNESDKSLKDSSSGKTGSYSSIGRKPSLENLKRKTSKDSSSSSSKEEQILISNLTRDKLLHRKNSLDQEAAIATANGVRHHTTIQRVKRADIVAAVTERLYSSRKLTEETSMATSNASDTRSPPEGTDVKISNTFIARSRLQEISRKMLMKRRRINVDTQTETASTLRFKDTACSTDEPKIVFQDAAVLTDNHMDCDFMTTSTNHRLPVLRVKDMATLTDRRPQTNIFHCKDAESLVNDLEFDNYELHSPRNDSGVLSDDTQNYAESNLSSAEVSEFYPESDRRAPRTDSSTNTFLASSGKNSAVQTARSEATGQRKENPESRSCNQCCGVLHAGCNQQRASASNTEKNVISISLPDMINITIESTNGLESKIAVMDGTDAVEERVKPVFNDKECQTDQLDLKKEVEGSFLSDLAIRSTAIQADGRVFRIENIFQDPRSKSCDVVSDLKKETKSVTFRNSLGTSSIIETKESSTETEWNGMHVEDNYQRKWSIPKESLTRAFIAKRRSYSLSPKRSAHKLVHHNIWKNLTLLCSEFPGLINHNRKMRTVSPCTKKDTNLTKNLLFSSMRECRERTSNNNVLEETSRESSNQNSRSSFKDSKSKSASINNLLDYDYNFSDDSLDYDKDDVAAKSVDVKVMDSNDRKYCESFCPPDVVAHTKNEASKSTHYVNSVNVESSASIESSTNDNFDDTEMELPKRKPAEMLNKSSIENYKELILGMSSYVIDSDSEEANVKMTNHSDVQRKKVSFLNLNSPEEIADTMINHENSIKQTSEVALKPIIKKMNKKLAVTENLNILQPNTEAGQFLQQKKTESTASKGVLLALKEDSKDSEEPSDKKMEFFNKNHLEEPSYRSNGVFNNEDTRFRNVLKKNIFEEYLNEATIFMRNINSMNEYMSVTNAQRHKKRHKKRNNRRGSNPNTNKDYIEIHGRKINLKNDVDKYLQPYEDEIIAAESYEKCLRGIERLEACIDKTNKHNRILQDRYGIDIESAGAKSSLASPSVDSRVSSINDSTIHRKDVISGVESCDKLSPSTISLPLLSSIQTGITKQSMLSKIEKFEADTIIDKYDSDYKNNNITPENDLERGIFDQLMRAADSSKCLNLKQPACLLKTSDFGSRSPTTYSKFWETFRQNARRILTFDEVSAVEDYLGNIRRIENSPRAFRKTKNLADIDSETSIDSEIDFKEFCDCNELPKEENDNLLKIDVTDETTIFKTDYPDCLIDSMRSIDAKQISYAEEIARRNTQKSKDSLRMESMNIRFSGPLNIELKYPGSPRAKFLELLRERRQIVEKSRGTNAF